MEKLDLTKQYKSYFTAKTKPEIVHFEAVRYLSLLGKGDPSGENFTTDIQALYSTAYAIKFEAKAAGNDFAVSKLEGLWWFDDARFGAPSITEAPKKIPRCEWEYRLLIRMPDFVSASHLTKGVEAALRKNLLQAAHIQWFEMTEGKCVQMMHIGPFETEPQTLEQMQVFMQAHDLKKNGFHHEIYLSDFRKATPDQLKTILREPVC